VGVWGHLTAATIQRRHVTQAFRKFLASRDLVALMLDSRTWRRWGITRVRARFAGQPAPQSFVDPDGDTRLRVAPANGALDLAWPDVVLATLLGELRGQPAPVVLDAVQHLPVGRQDGLVDASIPGTTLAPDDDPVVVLALLRQHARDADELVTAAMLRVLENGMIGQFNRDDTRKGRKVPGPWCWPPIYAIVTAGARCLLAVLEHQLGLAGGTITYRDTDGAIIASDTRSIWLQIPEGRSIRVIPRAELDAILAQFDGLDPFGDGQPFWTVKSAGISAAFGPKRYGINDEAGRRIAGTAHVIGAYLPPPGASVDWDHQVAAVHLRHLLSPAEPVTFDWETHAADFPALLGYAPATLADYRALPAGLGAHPFARLVEATADPIGPGRGRRSRPIALDPGGDRGDWQSWAWYDARSGEPIGVTTNLAEAIDSGMVRIETLAGTATAWASAKPFTPG
jgi:hypothetical protein